jgi:hypothetical protein
MASSQVLDKTTVNHSEARGMVNHVNNQESVEKSLKAGAHYTETNQTEQNRNEPAKMSPNLVSGIVSQQKTLFRSARYC